MAKRTKKTKKDKPDRLDLRGLPPGLVKAVKDSLPGYGPHEKNARLRYLVTASLLLLVHEDCPQKVVKWLSDMGSEINEGDPIPEDFWHELQAEIAKHLKKKSRKSK